MKCFFPFKSKNKQKESKSAPALRNKSDSLTPVLDRASKSLPSPRSIPELYKEKEQNLKVFSLQELRDSTNGFSRLQKLGEGGFGSVYKGIIKPKNGKGSPILVAIKKLNPHSLQGHKEWLAEVQFLSVVNHPNLVKLLGYCSVDGERGIQRLLVYEYMPNRSLEDHLFNRALNPLPWITRLQIMLGAAQGLAYLHEGLEVQPCELACYSRVEGGDVNFDESSLRLFKRLITEDIGADLNQGFDTFVAKKDLGSEGFGDLLACIRDKNIPLQNILFVTFRNNLNKILATAYIRHEPWEMGVHKRNGVVYLDVHKLPERPQNQMDRRRCYWGYCFESLATQDSGRGDGELIHHVGANIEYCSVIKTKLGAHRILMGAEMDYCHSTDDGRRFYVELKTSRELEYHTEERYEREKLLKFWIQSFLAGVPYIVIGFRDDSGRLVRTERLRTKDITQRVKTKNCWQGGVYLAFADEVLCWLYGTVKENEDYILQFAPPVQRLELLQTQSCPEAITNHVEQL